MSNLIEIDNSPDSEKNLEFESYNQILNSNNNIPSFLDISSSIYKRATDSAITNWSKKGSDSELIPLDFESFTNVKCSNLFDIGHLFDVNNNKEGYFTRKKVLLIPAKKDEEKQIHALELNNNSLKIKKPHQQSKTLWDLNLNNNESGIKFEEKYNKIVNTVDNNNDRRNIDTSTSSRLVDRNNLISTKCLYSSNKKSKDRSSWNAIRRSKKSTNVVKYKNVINEPCLKGPLSKCLLLEKYKISKSLKQTDRNKSKPYTTTNNLINKRNAEAQVTLKRKENALQPSLECDEITERFIKLFKSNVNSNNNEITDYINEVIKDIKINPDIHPDKLVLRNILRHWLKNKSIPHFKENMTDINVIRTSSNKYFTQDEILSNFVSSSVRKTTELHEITRPVQIKLSNMRETINRLINQIEISLDLTKEVFDAFLRGILHDSNSVKTNSHVSGSSTIDSPTYKHPTETICKTVSTLESHDDMLKSITERSDELRALFTCNSDHFYLSS